MQREGIVVTGLGPVSAIGIGREAFRRGISAEGLAPPVDGPAGAVVREDLRQYIATEKAYLDRASELALAAANLALADACLEPPAAGARDVGVILGTWFGPAQTADAYARIIAEKGPKAANPLLFTHAMANVPASLIAMEHGLRGENLTLTTGRLSGLDAVGYARDLLRHGRSVALLAGGVDSGDLTAAAGPSETGGESVRAEGAALVVLEPERRAAERGAPVHACLGGMATTDLGEAAGWAERIGAAYRAALDEASVAVDEVRTVLVADREGTALREAERRALAAIGLWPGQASVRGPWRMGGDALGSTCALGLIAAALEAGERRGAVLLDACDGSTFHCVVMTPGAGRPTAARTNGEQTARRDIQA